MSLDWIAQNRALLVQAGVLRQVLRVGLIEQALEEEAIPLHPPAELEALVEKFWLLQQLAPPQRQRWLAERDLDEAGLALIVSRPQRWQQWCRSQWGEKLGQLFLRHKDQLDVATASILRLEQQGLARELYLRLAENDSSFAEIARTHCADHPQRQGGQWGPKPLSDLPPRLAEILRTTPLGQLRGPERIGPKDWVVLRLEAFTPSRVDDPAVQRRLLQMEGESWLNQRIERWLKDQT